MTGCPPAGCCRCWACAGPRCSGCGGPASRSRTARSRWPAPASWWTCKVIEKGPKSQRGHRTLPLFPAVTAALEALYKTQLAERAAAGAAYAGDVDGGYVCADELGAAAAPGAVQRRVRPPVRAGRAAEVPPARLQAQHQLAAGEAGRAARPTNQALQQQEHRPRPRRSPNGVLTPTLKLKRRVIEERYRQQIDELYAQAEAASLP